MNKKIILGIVVIIVVGIALVAFKGGNAQKVTNKPLIYCTTDGTLSDTMPIQSHRSYCVKSDSNSKTYAVNTPSEYSFSIVDDQGNTLKNFAITHTKQMHVIVARKDLKYFQHVHPEFDQASGVFIFKDLTFPADGVYRIFADFAPNGGMKDSGGMTLPVTISEDVDVGSGTNYTPEGLGSEDKVKTFDSYQVSLSSDKALVSGKEVKLTFNLKQSGKPITDLEEYLGALGHAVILRESNLDFIHAHPLEDASKTQTGEVGFMVNFPEAGRYKVFTQFQRAGKVFTTDFLVSVALGTGADSTEGMVHPPMQMQ